MKVVRKGWITGQEFTGVCHILWLDISDFLKTWPCGSLCLEINQGKTSLFGKCLVQGKRKEREGDGGKETCALFIKSVRGSTADMQLCPPLGCPQPGSTAQEGLPQQEGREHILWHRKTLKLNSTTEENNFWELLRQHREVCATTGTSKFAWSVNTLTQHTRTPCSCLHPECSENSTCSFPHFHLTAVMAVPEPWKWLGGSRAVIQQPPSAGTRLLQTVVGDHSSGKTLNVSII